MVGLNDINEGIQKNKLRRRVGRGVGSGYGKTSSRGHKGDGSRAGHRSRRGYEGGQMPLFRRVAKRGFSNAAFSDEIFVLNVDQLSNRFSDGDTVTVDNIRKAFSISRKPKIKVLGRGEIHKRLNVEAHAFSASAETQIVAAGGSTVRV